MNFKNFARNTALSVAIALSMSSCSTVTVTDRYNSQQISPLPVTPIAHINAQCCGLYFFNSVPIIVGSTEWPGMFLLFNDNATPERCVSMLTEKASNLGATKVLDMTSQTRVEPNNLLFYVLTVRTCQVSGNAVK